MRWRLPGACLVVLALVACRPEYETPEIPQDSIIQRMPIGGDG